MNTEQINRTTEIITDLIIRNVEAGATIEQAKERAFNRMNKDYPEILAMWLSKVG